MATRSIVTSQPDVACDVCERRLLRGEQPDLFLDAGEPRMVCELCAPRAAHQGWQRGSAEHSPGAVAPTVRRGRNLFERLRGSRRTSAETAAFVSEQVAYADRPGDETEAYDFLTVEAIAGAPASAEQGEPAGVFDGVDPAARAAGEGSGAELSSGDRSLQHALDAFNAGEYPRRVASLARSLGAPEVCVRAGEAVASSVVIVVAWELCWYTYEVDLDDMQGTEARAIAQGTELSELGPGDRLANARADERGQLALL